MNLDSFTGPGSTPSRRRFWDKVTAAVNASQKIEGDNVTVAEHPGQGSLIDVAFSNRGRPGPNQGACCDEENNCTISTEEDCTGTFQGVGTVCDPNPCGEATGACCIDGVCSILSESDCTDGGGIFQGIGTDCDPDPCTTPTGACCHDDGSGTIICDIFTESFCNGIAGHYKGDGTDCSGGDPCGLVGACCDGCNGCSLSTEADCPITPNGESGFIAAGVSCFHATGNICCFIDNAVNCCIAGQFTPCAIEAEFGCGVFGGCQIDDCRQNASACSCPPFAPEGTFADPFFTNN